MANFEDDFKRYKSFSKKILSNKFFKIILLIIGVPFIFTLMREILQNGLFEAFDISNLFEDFFEDGAYGFNKGFGYIIYATSSLFVCHHIIKILKDK